jgi:hypothetical protein
VLKLDHNLFVFGIDCWFVIEGKAGRDASRRDAEMLRKKDKSKREKPGLPPG